MFGFWKGVYAKLLPIAGIEFSDGRIKTYASGSPEGVITATVGSEYTDTSSGILYQKRSGSGNTGWVATISLTEMATGSVGSPGLPFTGDANTGIYQPASDTIGFSASGSKVGEFNSNGLQALDNYLCVVDEKATNTEGGTFTSGAWRTRDLQTVRTNRISSASLSSNQISLPAGTYRIATHCPAYKVENHIAKLRDITNSTDLIIGTSEYCASTDDVSTRSFINGNFTIAGTTTLEIQHQCGSTQSSNGFGRGFSTFSVTPIYTTVEIWRLA